MAVSSMGDLTALWRRLSAPERDELTAFGGEFLRGLRCELRDDFVRARGIYHRLIQRHPRFETIATERIEGIDRMMAPVHEDTPDE